MKTKMTSAVLLAGLLALTACQSGAPTTPASAQPQALSAEKQDELNKSGIPGKTQPATPQQMDAIDQDVAEQQERAKIVELIADAEKNAAEEKEGLKTQSYLQGKDISIELLLYEPKASSRARFWGIKTASDLLYAGRSPMRRWALKHKLGGVFSPAGYEGQVMIWLQRADLLRVTTVQLQDAFLLQASGVTSVPDLARRGNLIDQTTLYAQMTMAAIQYGLYLPSFNTVQGWTAEARLMPPVIY